MVFNSIKTKLKKEICDTILVWDELPIWQNKINLRKIMYDDNKGDQQQLDLCYFDIPFINDCSKQSNDFFEALAETEDLELFESLSINIILEKAWSEHRPFFICFFTAPYCILIASYFIWSNFVMVEQKDSFF